MARGGTNPTGRPVKGRELVTEADYPAIYNRWIHGASINSLAADYKVSWQVMQHHLQRCRAAVKGGMIRDRNEVLDELAAVRSAAWECFQKSKRPLTHDEIQKEMDKVAQAKGISDETATRIVKQTTKITTRDGEATWLSVVLAAIDTESKLSGHYEAGKREGSAQGAKSRYRAAGRTPQATHEAMATRFVDLLTQRREALTKGDN